MKTWDLDYLDKLYTYFDKKKKLSKDDEIKIQEYQKSLNSITYILDSIKPPLKFHIGKTSAMECLYSDALLFHKFGHLCKYLRLLQEMHLKYEILYPSKKRIHFTDKQLIKLSNNFYSKVGGFISKDYKTILGRFNKILSISEKNIFTESLTQTLPIYNTNLAFINVSKNNGIEDIIGLIHEAGHAISALHNLNILEDDDRHAYVEIETIFLELLTFDYLETFDKYRDESIKLRLHYLRDFLYSSHTLCLKLDILNEFAPLNTYGIDPIMNYLKNELQLTKGVINNVLYDDASSLFNYSIDFLIALELYYMYKENNNKALDILKKIIECKFDTSIEYENYILSLGINPGEHLEEYIIKCFDYTKKGTSVYEKTI